MKFKTSPCLLVCACIRHSLEFTEQSLKFKVQSRTYTSMPGSQNAKRMAWICYNPKLHGGLISINIVHGFTRGLKHNQLRRIEKLGSRRVAPDAIISPELARQMTEISHETGRQVGVLINRKGQIEYVMVGNAKQIEMPDFGRARVSEDRFRGLRCVHTHLAGEKLTQDDLTDLALLRLDLMSIIQVDRKDGLPGMVYSAHLVPTTAEGLEAEAQSLPYQFLQPNIPSQLH